MSNRFLNKWLGAPEEINGGYRCPTYLYRWILVSTRWVKAYLHHFVGDDWSRDHHDHPKRFVSIGLKGWYIEETPGGAREYHAPWIRTFPAEHIHRLRVPSKSCWTMVIVFWHVREWGFWHEGEFIPWRDYVSGSKSHIADTMRSCD